MKYHDNSSYATRSLSLKLSNQKLKDLLPELIKNKEYYSLLIEMIEEHIYCSDSQPALVISENPSLVAVYSADIDAIIMLKFSKRIKEKYNLTIGTRLISINTYRSAVDSTDIERFYQPDIHPGSNRSSKWVEINPIIANFVSENNKAIEKRIQSISDDHWEYINSLAQSYLKKYPQTYRDGRPLYSAYATNDPLLNVLENALTKVYLSQRRFEEGIQTLYQALEKNPGCPETWLLIGPVEILRARYKMAKYALNIADYFVTEKWYDRAKLNFFISEAEKRISEKKSKIQVQNNRKKQHYYSFYVYADLFHVKGFYDSSLFFINLAQQTDLKGAHSTYLFELKEKIEELRK